MSKPKPCEVVLRFKSVEEKDRFVGGLFDGWGEGHAHFDNWEPRSGNLLQAESIDMAVFDEDEDA